MNDSDDGKTLLLVLQVGFDRYMSNGKKICFKNGLLFIHKVWDSLFHLVLVKAKFIWLAHPDGENSENNQSTFGRLLIYCYNSIEKIQHFFIRQTYSEQFSN